MTLYTRREHAGGAVPTTLASDATAGATTISIVDGTGWPTGSVGDFVVTLERGTDNEERILCASRTGAVLTVQTGGRGWDNTVARAHQSGSEAEHTWSTTEADETSAHLSTVAGHGVDVVVGTTEVQSISNKTLTSPVINTPDISGGSIDGSVSLTGATLTGNPGVSGNPTFSGTPVFSGNPNFTGQPTIGNLTNANHTHAAGSSGGNIPQSSVTGLTASLDAKLDDVQRGAANGVASLDASTLVPTAQLPNIPIAKVPTGTSGSTVALGDHEHLSLTRTTDEALTSRVVSDASPGPDNIGNVAIDGAGVWLILGSCRGFTLGSGGTNVRLSWSLTTSAGTLAASPVNTESSGTALSAGATVFGVLVASGAATVNMTVERVSSGGPAATTSATGTLVAIPMYQG